jgi:hypothetical protein
MDEWRFDQKTLIDDLALTSVRFMNSWPELAGLRQKWVDDKSLPDFPRALAFWSDADLFRLHLDLGRELFNRVLQRPLYEKANGRYFGRLIAFVDLAVAACWKAGNYELLDEVKVLWASTREIWAGQVDEIWFDIAGWLAAALKSDGKERKWLMEEPGFVNSYCNILLNENIST